MHNAIKVWYHALPHCVAKQHLSNSIVSFEVIRDSFNLKVKIVRLVTKFYFYFYMQCKEEAVILVQEAMAIIDYANI